MSKNQLNRVIEHLLKMNAVPFDKKELSFQIQSHPSYPSLHAITGVLDHFGIENVAADVPVNQETLEQLPETFIAQLNTEGIHELVSVTKKKSQFLINASAKKAVSLDSDQFLKNFTGIVVAVEKEKTTKSIKSSPWFVNTIWYTITALCLTILVLSEPAFDYAIFIALSVIGSIISIAIVRQESGLQTTLGNAFCSSNTEKKDCNAVLTSEGAKVFGKYKISDFGSIYFLSLTLLSFLFSAQKASSDYVFFLSYLALPITLYSIYYQMAVIKKWCLLCLSIVGILWLQAGVSYFALDSKPTFDFQDLLVVGLFFLAVFKTWNYLRAKSTQLQKAERSKLDFFKFKRDFNLFSTLLNQSPSKDTTISNHHEIQFGNEASDTTITIVTNPFCGHCKSVHELVENVLDRYQDDIKILIRFNIHLDNEDSDIVKITTRLLEIYHTDGKETCLTAMSDIYGGMVANDWLLKWGPCKEKTNYVKVLEEEKQWCIANQINFTPELLINGLAFPRAYEREDLIYFIEELSEESASTEAIEIPETV